MLTEDEVDVGIGLGARTGKSVHSVVDRNNIGHPVVGFIVEDQNGWFAITHRDEIRGFNSLDEAVSHVAKKWRYKR